jgi:hypothetical protein
MPRILKYFLLPFGLDKSKNNCEFSDTAYISGSILNKNTSKLNCSYCISQEEMSIYS